MSTTERQTRAGAGVLRHLTVINSLRRETVASLSLLDEAVAARPAATEDANDVYLASKC